MADCILLLTSLFFKTYSLSNTCTLDKDLTMFMLVAKQTLQKHYIWAIKLYHDYVMLMPQV